MEGIVLLRFFNGNFTYKLQHLDETELVFLTENRPAKRFLYFRFIISYIFAQKNGNQLFINKMNNDKNFWASPGEYLRKSTLISLARNISGLELPPNILDKTTFEGTASEETDDTLVLSAHLRAAYVSTIKNRGKGE